MSLFFSASSKIQKDRSVLKRIDYDLSKRSLPGVFSYFLVYLVIDFLMGYPEEHRLFSYSFGLIALVIAAARIFVALGFEKQYSKGPTRWRGLFLWLSLLNAVIWGSLLCFVLIHDEFSQANTIALVYTAALTSGITMVYVQYIRFVKIYLFVVLIPPAIILLFKFTVLDFVMGIGVLGYLAFLFTESIKYHLSFWERVDSRSQLEQKIALLNASRIENEQRAYINENVLSTVMQMIKTPLQGVLGMISLLTDTKLNNEQRQALDIANQSGDDLVNLIADLEDFTQLRNGHIQIENKYFDLRKYTEHLLESLGPQAHQLQIELSFLYNIDVPSRVSLDKKQIGQVIQSLITYALSHTKEGEVVFKISSTELNDQSNIRFCTYCHTDEININEVKSLIHNMRIDQQNDLSSSLLSLMISSRLVELMGGSIDLKAVKPGIYRVIATVPMEASSQQIDAFQPDKLLQDKKLLLVDMAERAGKGLAAEANSWGMNAVSVTSAKNESISEHKAEYCLFNLPLTKTKEELFALVDRMRELTEDDSRLILYGSVDNRRVLREKYPDTSFLAKPAGRYSMHKSLLETSVDDSEEYNADIANANAKANADKRILVAEDNPVNKLVTEALLKKLGYQYKSVNDGEELLQVLQEADFDLILMDCQMPKVDGFEATIKLRNNEFGKHQRIPIVALTAKASVDEERHCLTVGMDDCLAKPITLTALGSTLQRWLD